MHDPSEGPGTIEDYLVLKGIDVYTVRLYACELLPQALDDYDAVVTMGGPMNVYEDEKYPFLRDEVNFLKQTMDRGVPCTWHLSWCSDDSAGMRCICV